jgi:hypothetical protein
MSFLLKKPTKRSDVGDGKPGLQNRTNINFSLNGHDTRIIPLGRDASAKSLAGGRFPPKQPIPGTRGRGQTSVPAAGARMEVTGDQIIIQRQKPNRLPLLSQNQHQQNVQLSSKQKQESIAVISMEEGETI